MITIIPAIDLKEGKCVRLRQGKAADVTVYSEDPIAMARDWAAQGAKFLHVVDLDGAFKGSPVHTEIIGKIAAAIDVPVETGGGLRTADDIQALLDVGVRRAILGTAACRAPETLAELVKRFGDRLAVGIDARNGLVQVKGWVETTGTRAVDLAVKLDSIGVKTLIYTDTAVDGMLTGVNLSGVSVICKAVKCNVIASGGIASASDIRALCALKLSNLTGAITGKALYEKRITLKELIAAS